MVEFIRMQPQAILATVRPQCAHIIHTHTTTQQTAAATPVAFVLAVDSSGLRLGKIKAQAVH
jgi:hypothetical protein